MIKFQSKLTFKNKRLINKFNINTKYKGKYIEPYNKKIIKFVN